MEREQNFLVKATMTYGLYVGLALSAVMVMMHLTGQIYIPGNNSGIANTLIMAFGMLYFGRKFQMQYYPDGILYKKALGFSVLLGVFAAIIIGFLSYWYFKIIEPGAIGVFVSQLEVMLMEGSTIPTEQQEVILNMYRELLTPGALAFGVGFNQAFSGVLISLIVSYFIKSPLHLRNFKQE